MSDFASADGHPAAKRQKSEKETLLLKHNNSNNSTNSNNSNSSNNSNNNNSNNSNTSNDNNSNKGIEKWIFILRLSSMVFSVRQ